MEVLFKCNASGGYRDGDVIDGAPLGVLFSPAEIVAYFQSGTVPAGWGTLPNYKQRALKRHLEQTKWIMTHTIAEIQAAFSWSEQTATERKAIATELKAVALAEGLDSNWGDADLRGFGVLRVDALTPELAREVLDVDQDDDFRAIRRGKRRWRVDYESVLSAGDVANLRDSSVRVEAFRASSYGLGVFTDEPRAV